MPSGVYKRTAYHSEMQSKGMMGRKFSPATRAKIGAANTKHGSSRTTEYRSWSLMKARCSETSSKYKYYAGRGITVCNRWQLFDNFLEDMGKKPTPEHTIERIDNNGNYEPSNCRWATRKEQANNRRPRFATLVK